MRFLYGLASAHDFFDHTFSNPDDNALTDMDSNLALHAGVDATVGIGSDIGVNDRDVTGGDVGGDVDGKDNRRRRVSGGIQKDRTSAGVLENRVPILPDHASSEAATDHSPFAKRVS